MFHCGIGVKFDNCDVALNKLMNTHYFFLHFYIFTHSNFSTKYRGETSTGLLSKGGINTGGVLKFAVFNRMYILETIQTLLL